ncbi:Signal recognition particle receptor FtsY [Candidatus Clavichlamydia salmonicola]|uniref:signal recognition particle-docking protein FtsY n=1 Tax=Candidatus Clavichlamydia salmonicola TaxID=469812 RepID=UPI00189100C1|nr:signal recognition particle-docking protein FtsY [Candidatus Clavichlamydia salmonicola]MBF5050454.1 Signal recognition particle receptor FtsY [Candidatus Clavichlamydia salmonicola]
MLKLFKNALLTLIGKKQFSYNIDELQSLFYGADFGRELTEKLTAHIQTYTISTSEDLFQLIETFLFNILSPFPPFSLTTIHTPRIIMICGTNGSGKTTSTAKLINFLQKHGQKIVVGNTDTFRAGAQEQLKIWQNRLHFDLIKGQPGGDPASIAFDTIKAGISRSADTIIIDTSGRQANNTGLIRELEKIISVSKKAAPQLPIEPWIVLDSTLGQAAYEQTLGFKNHIPLSGFIFTKTDGTAKGGILFKIADKLKLSPLFLGCGENLNDFIPFNAQAFCKGLIAL